VDTDTARKRLKATRAALTDSQTQLGGVEAKEFGELSSLDQHPADVASELAQAESEDALRLVVEQQLAEVDAALARIEDGSYGKCVDCGEDMLDERLDARPEAARCLSCQQALEVAR
jgi:RNA polymerase-binding transcription factor DksA